MCVYSIPFSHNKTVFSKRAFHGRDAHLHIYIAFVYCERNRFVRGARRLVALSE